MPVCDENSCFIGFLGAFLFDDSFHVICNTAANYLNHFLCGETENNTD